MKTIRILPTLIAALALSAALLATGCASVTVCDKGPNMVTVENDGCFLFYCIPLFSGDPDYPNQQVCNWFSNTVDLETNVRLLDEAARERGAKIVPQCSYVRRLFEKNAEYADVNAEK